MPCSHDRADRYLSKTARTDTRGICYPLPQFETNDQDWLAGIRVLVISADGPELPEIDVPIEYLKERGADVMIAGQNWIFSYRDPPGYIVVAQWLADDLLLKADLEMGKVRTEDFDAIFIPGGAWNPDMLRTDDEALRVVREARKLGLLIVSLCHGPQVIVSANASTGGDPFPAGTRITGVKNIRVDLRNAGFEVVETDDPEDKPDAPPVFDEPTMLLTARNPYDLGSLCREMGKRLRQRAAARAGNTEPGPPAQKGQTRTGGSKAEIEAFVTRWFGLLDAKGPKDELLSMLCPDVRMEFPNDGVVKGRSDASMWYDTAMSTFFDTSHRVVSVQEAGEECKDHHQLRILVEWEASRWTPPARNSERIRARFDQTWLVTRAGPSGAFRIASYAVMPPIYHGGSAQL